MSRGNVLELGVGRQHGFELIVDVKEIAHGIRRPHTVNSLFPSAHFAHGAIDHAGHEVRAVRLLVIARAVDGRQDKMQVAQAELRR